VPDLYAGEPVVVAARLGTVHGELVTTGVRAHRGWEQRLPLAVGRERSGIHRLWARRKIAALMDDRTRGAEEESVRARVVEVALAHCLVSSYTSLVAVDVTPSRPADAALEGGAVPTNLPAGWQYEKVFGSLPKGGTPARMHLMWALFALLAALVARGLRSGL